MCSSPPSNAQGKLPSDTARPFNNAMPSNSRNTTNPSSPKPKVRWFLYNTFYYCPYSPPPNFVSIIFKHTHLSLLSPCSFDNIHSLCHLYKPNPNKNPLLYFYSIHQTCYSVDMKNPMDYRLVWDSFKSPPFMQFLRFKRRSRGCQKEGSLEREFALWFFSLTGDSEDLVLKECTCILGQWMEQYPDKCPHCICMHQVSKGSPRKSSSRSLSLSTVGVEPSLCFHRKDQGTFWKLMHRSVKSAQKRGGAKQVLRFLYPSTL